MKIMMAIPASIGIVAHWRMELMGINTLKSISNYPQSALVFFM
jgi:hypothetical protein